MDRIDQPGTELQEKLVALDWPSKTTKGGRTRSVRALVVVGDGQGRVGAGLGKAGEVSEAIKKGVAEAKKNLITVPMIASTITHEVIGRHGAGQVLLKPAGEGTGVIAGGPIRAVLELAGVKDVLTKNIGSSNAIAMVSATMDGLRKLRRFDEVARLRGKTVEDLMK
ncbi:MAG: 30S ribosomal protein S5 [Bacillota bacterium]|jgi:small subunit ribosomal protein S5|nr:30S ribosomal protein S5 [Bacillota bacterium]HOB91639.1 30S ribosomal protein S5 [Bacillota bacterium]HPZ54443.1 30S ribosomal protein S5 [Bacillota bacterium]HQD17779.1 30S ribosomal protein S5 [Bacillota bacterium]